MKSLLISTVFLVLISCGKTSDHTGHDKSEDGTSGEANQALYDQVMDIHDEVMPKMEDIYKMKIELLEKIANTPGMVEEKRKELEAIISNLDSTNNAMMDWMHNFNPIPDSLDQEKAREYLETEMERIKKVRDRTIEALGRAKEKIEK